MRPSRLSGLLKPALLLVTRGRCKRLVLPGTLALAMLALALAAVASGSTASIAEQVAIQPTSSAPDIGSAQAPRGGRSHSSSTAVVTGYLPLVLLRFDPAHYSNCRFGVGQAAHPVTSYGIPSLNLGWYSDWGAQVNPPRPADVEYVQMLHVSSGGGHSPSGTALADIIANNPGALWLIGNEPDCIHQNNVLPEDYARAYHDAHAFIKEHDPTARVAVGGIVQPTPLRMQYLDMVLDEYVTLYGEALPTDAWHIHSFILREKRGDWGCDIPPGIAVDEGMLYTFPDDTDRVDIFQDRIMVFRQWMRDQGYRDTPLIITEYGTLAGYYDPDWKYVDSNGDPMDEARARDFMTATFDYLLSANDPDLGYPADENRLVQRWLWYSLDDAIAYGGALFDPFTFNMLQLGQDFGDYTSAIPPTVDLLAVDVTQVGPVPFSPTSPATVTLRARVSNVGNVAIAQPVTVRLLDGNGHQIGSDETIAEPIAGCAEIQEVSITWSNVPPGLHTVWVVVDPEDEVSEADEDNNQVQGAVLVAE